MDEVLKALLLGSHGLGAYALIFGVLVACGMGVPLPEDISLLIGGFLAHKEAVSLPVMMAVGFFGILGGDSLIFMAGRRLGTRRGKAGGFLEKVVTPEKRAKVQTLFHRHGQKIVMLARFLPGVRAVTYFTAGSAHMPYYRFLLFDGIAALASAPLFVFLGFHFGGELEVLIRKLKEGQLAVVLTLLGLLLCYLLIRYWTNYRRLKALAQAQAEEAQGRGPKALMAASSGLVDGAAARPARVGRSAKVAD